MPSTFDRNSTLVSSRLVSCRSERFDNSSRSRSRPQNLRRSVVTHHNEADRDARARSVARVRDNRDRRNAYVLRDGNRGAGAPGRGSSPRNLAPSTRERRVRDRDRRESERQNRSRGSLRRAVKHVSAIRSLPEWMRVDVTRAERRCQRASRPIGLQFADRVARFASRNPSK